MKFPPVHTAPRGRAARAWRYAYRTPLLAWHLLVDLPITLLLIALGRGGWLSHAMVRWWSGGLLRVFGMRLQREGAPLPGGTLFVANHVSWVDIMVLHSQHMMGFIAKSEIRRWPLVGWITTHAETIFLQRGNGDSLGQVMAEMVQRLRAGRAVAAFPEGGTRDGRALGAFHARIFATAVEANAPVQPVALCYGARCEAQAIVAFAPRESFLGNFLRLLGEPARPVRVCFTAPVDPGQHDGRRGIAEAARAQVLAAMQAG
ncbi:1-acyl-sn-glycerol-3-phosphate acyltransferase [Thermomonas sp. S9]|uniref:lysophospholipid acyltransferase family protein n=1 Tax=Thermomonas sp. S9 TaxID=2885203 RepID=UPI00216B2F20|nr:lysophospholipid acyltransferase family protein [Thermomonas sp. S9]MCR6495122.1 1-acyl-sn-glycerol-3-phosphate acyltransferase [Thermomonas sp. S9]